MAGARGQRINAGLLKNRAADFLMQGALAETRAIENMFAGVNSSIASGRARKEREAAMAQQAELSRQKEAAVNQRFLISEQNQNARFGITESRRAAENKNRAIRDERKLQVSLQAQLNTAHVDASTAQAKAAELARADDAIMKATMPIEAKLDLLRKNEDSRKSIFGYVKAAIGLGKIPKESLVGNIAVLDAAEKDLAARTQAGKTKLSGKAGFNKAMDTLKEIRIRKAAFTEMLQTQVADDERAVEQSSRASVVDAAKSMARRNGLGSSLDGELETLKNSKMSEEGIRIWANQAVSAKSVDSAPNPDGAKRVRDFGAANNLPDELIEPIAASVEDGGLKEGAAFGRIGSSVDDVRVRTLAESRAKMSTDESSREIAAADLDAVEAEISRQRGDLQDIVDNGYGTPSEIKAAAEKVKNFKPDLSGFTDTPEGKAKLKRALAETGNVELKRHIRAALNRSK